MNVKWQKNAHILIKSHSGDLTVDGEGNIRRASFLGRVWFRFVDWFTKGKKSEQLKEAVEKTLTAIQTELGEVQVSLSDELNKLPSDYKILKNVVLFNYNHPFSKGIIKIQELTNNSLILKGKGGFYYFGIPNYGYCSECLRDIPQAVKKHSQISEMVTHQAIKDIEDFFTLGFINNDSTDAKKIFLKNEIDKRDRVWVE